MLDGNDTRFFPLLVHRTSLMVRYAAPLLSNKPANVYEYGLSQPTTVPGNSSRILSVTRSSTYLFLVGADCCLVNVPLTILIHRSVSTFSVMFITGMSTDAVFNQCRASTFDIVSVTKVSTAVVLQLFSMFSSSSSRHLRFP